MCAWPGCPMGHGWDEPGTKGVLIAELDQETSMRFIPLDVPKFYDLELPVGEDAAQALVELLPGGGSEDFAYVSQKVPSLMLALAAGQPEKGFPYPQHHPKVRFDESVLSVGAAAFVQMAARFLEEN